MVIGDNVKTAKAIVVECGILNSYADATEPNIMKFWLRYLIFLFILKVSTIIPMQMFWL